MSSTIRQYAIRHAPGFAPNHYSTGHHTFVMFVVKIINEILVLLIIVAIMRAYPDHGARAPTKENIFQVILSKCCYCYPNEIDRFMQQYHTSMPQRKMGVFAGAV
jgi:hypothetical protein